MAPQPAAAAQLPDRRAHRLPRRSADPNPAASHNPTRRVAQPKPEGVNAFTWTMVLSATWHQFRTNT
jgi:hypothetical protein